MGPLKNNKKERAAIPKLVGWAGMITRQPLLIAAISGAMAAYGGARGRRAALRGSVCYLLGAAAGNLPKPLFGRAQPRHKRTRKPEIARGSFPSGHATSQVAYVLAVSQEIPSALMPLSIMATAGILSLVKAGKHFVSDTLVGGGLGVLIAWIVGKVWPPKRSPPEH